MCDHFEERLKAVISEREKNDLFPSINCIPTVVDGILEGVGLTPPGILRYVRLGAFVILAKAIATIGKIEATP